MCSVAQLWLFVTSWTIARQAPLSMEFSRQEYWSRLSFPTPGDLPYPGTEPESLASPALAGEFFTTVVVQLLSRVWLFKASWIAACQASCPSLSPGICSNSCRLSLVKLSNHLILCCPLLLLPSIFPSIRGFSSELVLHIRWPKYWSSSFSNSLPGNIQGWFPLRLTGLISLQVQGTLKSLLQHHSLKAPVLWCSALFMIQFLNPYITSGKTTALTVQILVGKVLSLLFTTLSWFVIAFLTRSKCLTIICLSVYYLFCLIKVSAPREVGLYLVHRSPRA